MSSISALFNLVEQALNAAYRDLPAIEQWDHDAVMASLRLRIQPSSS